MEEKSLTTMVFRIKLSLVTVALLIFISACQAGRKEAALNADYYPEIVNAEDGSRVTVRGYVDSKGICNEPDPDHADPKTCRTALYKRCPFAYVPIRIPYCQDKLGRNCILQPSSPNSSVDVEPILRDMVGNDFPPGAEVRIDLTVSTLASGWKAVKEIRNIEVVPGSFDPVNVTCNSSAEGL